MVYSADSFYIVTASSDSYVKLWDARTGEVVNTYAGHSLAVISLALNDLAM